MNKPRTPELPLDIDHCCGIGAVGGSPPAVLSRVVEWGRSYHVDYIPNSSLPRPGQCPGCTYMRGWQDARERSNA